MFIAFQVFAVLGIIAGILIFFYGLALFNSYINSAKSLQNSKQEEDNTTSENVSENNTSDIQQAQCEEPTLAENSTDDNAFNNSEDIALRKKIFTPLPYFLLIEGVILFVFNIVMLVMKFHYPKMMEFYVLLPINIGFILLSVFVDAMVMTRKSDDSEIINDNSIDKTE